jgi:hypothetical protein
MEQIDKIAFSQDELDAIKAIQSKFNNATQRIGLLLYEKKVIERDIAKADEALERLEDEKEALMNQFMEKYGVGHLDLESGEFTPAQ